MVFPAGLVEGQIALAADRALELGQDLALAMGARGPGDLGTLVPGPIATEQLLVDGDVT